MKAIDIHRLTGRYQTRILKEDDIDDILRITAGNPLFYEYTEARGTREAVLSDMQALPPHKTPEDKYYFGFFEKDHLLAVMDLISGYPDEETAFIGFFMMDHSFQGRGIGKGLIADVCAYLKQQGFTKVRLCINQGNPQSSHFWHRCGFRSLYEAEREEETVIVAEKNLKEEMNMKTAVAYFSASGVTAAKAKEIAGKLDGYLCEIRPAVPYTAEDLDWRNPASRSSVEMKDPSSRPALAGTDLDFSGCDRVLVGFPIWWYTAPHIINTFLETYDLSGKEIILFATSGGSGIERAVRDLQAAYPHLNISGGRLANGSIKGIF